MLPIRGDTQTVLPIGPVVDKDDALTLITTLDIATADYAAILKHGDPANSIDISGFTWAASDADGYYALTATAGSLDTYGGLVVAISDVSLNLQVRAEFWVLAPDVFDLLFANGLTDITDLITSEVPDVNVKSLNDVVLTGSGTPADPMTHV